MKNTFKISKKYYNIKNRNYPLSQNLYGVLKTDPSSNYKEELSKNDLMHLSNVEMYDNILSKALSKKKRRGILDISSPGNKDVLTDSDSEIQTNRNTKNGKIIDGDKKINKKNKCAKLIIEKVESQAPKINEEYYKFTNQKRDNISNSGNIRYNNNKIKRINSPFNENYLNSFKNTQTNKINNNNKNVNINTQSRDYTNPKGFQNPSYLNVRNNNYISNNKKDALTTDSSTNDNNYNYINQKFEKSKYISKNSVNRNILNGLNKSNNNYYQIKKLHFHNRSTGISIDNVYNSSNNNIIYKSNKKDNNITDNTDYEFSTPIHSSVYNDDSSYPPKRTIGLKINLAPNKKHQKILSMHRNCNTLLKKPSLNELINLNYNTKSNKTYLQNKFNEKLIKSITKIQSFWRGAFIRELMTFVTKINNFFDTLHKIILNHKKKKFFYFLNILKNIEKPKIKKISVETKFNRRSMRQRYILNNQKKDKPVKYKNNEENEKNDDDINIKKEDKDNNKKHKKVRPKNNEDKNKTDNDIKNENEDNNLLQNYNLLMDKYNKLKEEMDKMIKNNKKFENLDIDKNELGIIDKKKKKVKKDEKDEKNIDKKIKINKKDLKTSNSKIKKIFDIIVPEQNEKFKIIPKSINNLRYRTRKLNKNKIEKVEKVSEIKFEGKNKNKIEKVEKVSEINFEGKNGKQNKNKIKKVEKVSQIKFEGKSEKLKKTINYDDYLNHFKSNINISKNDHFIIKEIPNINKKILNLIPFDISNNSLTLINDKKRKSDYKNNKNPIKEKETMNDKSLNIKPLNISNNYLTIINNKKRNSNNKTNKSKSPIKEKEINNEYLNIKPLYISNNCLTIKHNKKSKNKYKEKNVAIQEKPIIPKIFENVSINKNKENDLSIIITKKDENTKLKEKKQKIEIIAENQKNLNTEIKGFESKKLKIFNDCIVFEHNNNINIIQIKKQKEFDKEQMHTKNDILLNIISESKPKTELNKKIDKISFNDKSLIFNKIINLKILENIPTNYYISNDNKDNINVKNNELIVEKNDDILLKEEKNKIKKFDEILMIDNNNILYVKRKNKIKFDKMTEITEELNKIEPNNHYELIFKGKINLNENLENMNIEKNEEKAKKSENFEKNGKNEITEEIKIYVEEKKKKNYNEENEVEKGDGLEINPLEIKKNKPNNIIISYENKIEVLYNKNASEFTEKAKKNMMKIILPIRLKTVLREYIRKSVYPLLIKKLKIKK